MPKFIVRLLLTITLLCAGYALPVLAIEDDGYWDNIDDYAVQLQVRPNGTLHVHEVITYTFGDGLEPAHGIERYVPYNYANGWFTDQLDIRLNSVTDQQGEEWPVETYQSNGNSVWRIGSDATTVRGTQVYALDYDVDWVMTDYQDYVELYWNAIGTEWNVPISKAKISVTVPPDSQLEQYPASCFYGASGDDNTCSYSVAGNTYTAELKNLGDYQGMTVLFAFKPGTVTLHSTSERIVHWALANWTLFLIPGWLLLALLLLVLSRRRKPSKALIPIYEIPTGIENPSQAEYLLTGKITPRALAGELIESARLGEMELIYDEKKGEVKTLRATGKVVRTDPTTTLLRNQIFGVKYAAGREVELKKTTLISTGFMVSTKKQAADHLQAMSWIDSMKKTIKTMVGLYGLGGFVLGGFVVSSYSSAGVNHYIITGVSMMILSVITFFVQNNRLPLNVAGADARQLVEGFKWFLGVTETERLKFSQVPKLTPKMFEEYLPYAIVFGVERQWVKQFEGILQDPPTWMHGVNQALLYNALLSTSRTPSQFKVPASARSGGSGFSGGGFSGGGFGGGGGGRW